MGDTGREWEVRFNPVLDLAGKVTSVVAVAVDVTERPARGRRIHATALHHRPATPVPDGVERTVVGEAILAAIMDTNGHGARPWR